MPTRYKVRARRSRFFGLLLLLVLSGCDRSTVPAPPAEVWRSIPLESGATFNAVYFLDAQNGWLAGGSHLTRGGLLGSTTDGGLHWSFASRIANGNAKHLTSVHFFNDKRGVAGTDNGEVLTTRDGGRSWETTLKLSERFGNRVSGFAAGGSSVAYAVVVDKVIRTDDRGSSWYCLTAAAGNCPAAPECPDAGVNPDLNASAIAVMSPRRIAVISERTAIATSEDGGCTWQKDGSLTGPDRVRLNDLHFADENHGWVVGENGFVAATADGGRHWNVQTAAVAVHLTSAHFTSPSSGYLVGQRTNRSGSVVLSTRAGGTTRKVEQTVENTLLNDVFVGPLGNAWAAGGVLDVTASQHLLRKHALTDVTAPPR